MRILVERVKARFLSGLLVFVWLLIGYFSLQYCEIREVWWLDGSLERRWVPVRSWATWPYLSYFVMIPFAALSIDDESYASFIRAAFLTATVSFLIFAFLPTGLRRESLMVEELPTIYHWFAKIDQPRNAFPSLHVSLACLAAIFWSKRGKYSGLFGWSWVVAIAWSALSLRQHVWMDVVGGALLAWLAVRVVRHYRR